MEWKEILLRTIKYRKAFIDNMQYLPKDDEESKKKPKAKVIRAEDYYKYDPKDEADEN